MPVRNPFIQRFTDGRLLWLAVTSLAVIAAIGLTFASPEKAPAVLPTVAGPATLVRVDPASQSVGLGTNVVVEIRVDQVTNLAAYEFELHYYGSTLGFVSVINGPFLASTGLTPFCLPAQLDAGKVRYGCVTQAAQTGVSGSGLLATVTLSTSCGGTTPLTLKLVGLSNPLGSDIPTGAQDGSATVTGAPYACPTPTPTLRPTSTGTILPTRTPTAAGVLGDSNCDRTVNAIDAALDLQYSAGLVTSLACRQNADANHDGSVNAIDALLKLQLVAGLISHL